jgi:transcriptional regulator with XRE-family HTH domain
MGDERSDSQDKPWFAQRIRWLRRNSNQSQRQVAEAIGVKESTYANAEASHHRRLRRERVERLAHHHGLNQVEVEELIAGWQAMPESEYNRRNSKTWASRDARKSKLKAYDPLRRALLEMVSLVVGVAADPETLCSCEEPDMFAPADAAEPVRCEICNALHLLGLGAWDGPDATMSKLADMQRAEMTGKPDE